MPEFKVGLPSEVGPFIPFVDKWDNIFNKLRGTVNGLIVYLKERELFERQELERIEKNKITEDFDNLFGKKESDVVAEPIKEKKKKKIK